MRQETIQGNLKKSFAVIYGVIAYVIFLISFLYAIGFAGNFIVPKTIDSGEPTNLIKAIFVNVGLLTLFALQHSVMARPAFKKWWTRIIGPAIERSTYVLLSSMALILLYWQWKPLPATIWKIENNSAAIVLTAVSFLGWLIVLLSSFMINHFELFGLKQVFENFRQRKAGTSVFITSFFYKIVRHPIMLGFLIAFWATPYMTAGHLLFSVTTTLYIFIAVKFFEEKDLRKMHGQEYEDYQRKVPMIIPALRRPAE